MVSAAALEDFHILADVRPAVGVVMAGKLGFVDRLMPGVDHVRNGHRGSDICAAFVTVLSNHQWKIGGYWNNG